MNVGFVRTMGSRSAVISLCCCLAIKWHKLESKFEHVDLCVCIPHFMCLFSVVCMSEARTDICQSACHRPAHVFRVQSFTLA